VFVAGFIGSPPMNFLPAAVSADGGRIEMKGGHAVPTAGVVDAPAAGRTVTLGIRPEHLTLESGKGVGDIAVEVELVEALGADTLVHTRIAASGETLIARLPGSTGVAVGDTMHLRITPGEVHLFDPDSGRRL
jgi:sn-glycerol 3-phosphate transport system ATP-binding protein